MKYVYFLICGGNTLEYGGFFDSEEKAIKRGLRFLYDIYAGKEDYSRFSYSDLKNYQREFFKKKKVKYLIELKCFPFSNDLEFLGDC